MPKLSYVYIVQFSDMLKIGYSRSLTPQQQTWRYATFYHKFGLNIWKHSDPKALERQLKINLKPFSAKANNKKPGELFWNREYPFISETALIKAKRVCTENNATCTQKIGYDCGTVTTFNVDTEKSNVSGNNANKKQNANSTKASYI